jgi:hypothetical protein
MKEPFVPDIFKVPEKLETDKFRLCMLTVNDVVKDYDAVMTSVDHLQGTFGKQSTWPSKDLTLEQDLIDLGVASERVSTEKFFCIHGHEPRRKSMLRLCLYISIRE